jgi:hypothetical protein
VYLLQTVKGEIRTRLEGELRQQFDQSETVEQEVQLDGNVHPAYKITWYNRGGRT